jgi:hypothetical protein
VSSHEVYTDLELGVDYFNSYGKNGWRAIESNDFVALRPVDANFRV